MVDALVDHFRDKPDIYIWFDNFTVNQHNLLSTNRPFTWWCTTFQEAIRSFGHTVMVLSPWRCPTPLTRAWCLWELYCTATTKSKFEVAMKQEEQNEFFRELALDPDVPIDRMLSAIDVKNANAWKKEDLDNIFKAIAQIGGYGSKENHKKDEKGAETDKGPETKAVERVETATETDTKTEIDKAKETKTETNIVTEAQKVQLAQEKQKGCEILNAVVFRRMKEWVIEVSEQRLATKRFTAGQRLEDKLVLGSLYLNYGRYEKAEPILIECTEYFRRRTGKNTAGEETNPFHQFVAMNYLGALHGKKNRHEKALSLLQTALDKKRELMERAMNTVNDSYHNRAHVVKAHYELGKYFELCNDFAKAWEHFHLGIEICDEAIQKFRDDFPEEHLMIGMNHINRMTILNPPKSVSDRMEDEVKMQMDASFEQMLDIINRIKDEMISQGSPEKLFPLQTQKFGENHQILVFASINQAMLCEHILSQKRDPTEDEIKRAKEAYLQAIKRAVEILGDRHPETVKLLKILSNFFRRLEAIYKVKGKTVEEKESQRYATYYYLDYHVKI